MTKEVTVIPELRRQHLQNTIRPHASNPTLKGRLSIASCHAFVFLAVEVGLSCLLHLVQRVTPSTIQALSHSNNASGSSKHQRRCCKIGCYSWPQSTGDRCLQSQVHSTRVEDYFPLGNGPTPKMTPSITCTLVAFGRKETALLNGIKSI